MENKMKVVAFNGSPHKNGNTSLLIKEVFKTLPLEFSVEAVKLLEMKTIKADEDIARKLNIQSAQEVLYIKNIPNKPLTRFIRVM